MFSKACEYGIRATVYIALQTERGLRVGLKEISKAIDSPEAFTAKILQQLGKDEIIVSTKGPTGGFEMTPRQLKTIMLSDVVKSIDGDLIYKGCGLGFADCNPKQPCPLHHEFTSIREKLRLMLETTPISNLTEPLANGKTMLKR